MVSSPDPDLPSHPCLSLFYVYSPFLPIALSAGQFMVTGPTQPVVAMFGAEVELPCHLDPQMNAEHMEVRWYRDDVSNVVHHYREGKDLDEEQILDYAGRTELLKEGLTDGRVTLRLHNVLFLDDGDYVCHVQDGEFYEQAIIHLSVAGELLVRYFGIFSEQCLRLGFGPRFNWTLNPILELVRHAGKTLQPTQPSL
uniref:Ig-like domain-containing protein n=1 Tax=Ornithorhynchus anatinus TaxID=9258 RepID=A0A6I8P8X9_ORNAN